MNIFSLHLNPAKCAKLHCDQHVVKMILETAQMLSTAQWKLVPEKAKALLQRSLIYKPTHKNHPCVIWVCDSLDNYEWLSRLGKYLCKEYTERYQKVHKSQRIIQYLRHHPPENLERRGLTERPQAMPPQYRDKDPVVAYRRYYVNEKMKFARWKHGIPDPIVKWIKQYDN
jgi:hypothetical protein